MEWVFLQDNPEAAQFRLEGLPFTNELDIIFDGTIASEETEPSARRRKLSDGSASSLFHIEGPVDANPELRTDRGTNHLNDAVESRGIVTSQSSLGKLNYTIGECIKCLDGMEGMEQGSELYFFALDIFLEKEYREVFLQLKKSSVKAAWLQWMQTAGPPLPFH